METSFIAVINDPLNPIERTKEDGSPVLNKHGVKKTFTQSYKIEISGDNAAQFLGRSIGDEVDGIYISDGETTLSGYKLQIQAVPTRRGPRCELTSTEGDGNPCSSMRPPDSRALSE